MAMQMAAFVLLRTILEKHLPSSESPLLVTESIFQERFREREKERDE